MLDVWETVSGAVIYYAAPDRKASFNVPFPGSAGNLTLDQLANAGRLMVENMHPGSSIMNEENVQVSGREGREWVILLENFGGTGGQLLVREDFFLANGKVYTIAFSAFPEVYDNYRSTFDYILNSFTVF